MAKIFKIKCHKINFHPLGFSLELDNIYFIDFYKQILILFAGPLTFFISIFLIYLTHKFNIISFYQYQLALENNLSLFIFNMIPFFPLDGGRIFELILYKFIPVLKTKKIILLTNFFLSLILIFLSVINNQLLMIFFIVYNLLFSLITFKKDYKKYLYSRVGNVSSFKKSISDLNSLKHFNHNYLLISGNLLDEELFIIQSKIDDIRSYII